MAASDVVEEYWRGAVEAMNAIMVVRPRDHMVDNDLEGKGEVRVKDLPKGKAVTLCDVRRATRPLKLRLIRSD